MQLAKQLQAAGLRVFPCAIRYDAGKAKWQKYPLTVDHEPWAETAARAHDDPSVQWAGANGLGLVIPPDVVVIDLDTYNPDSSTAAADAMFGIAMPWAAAHVQSTVSGGSHYAFRAPAWEVRQGAKMGAAKVDTRVTGRGFICAGEGYAPVGAGLVRLAFPDSLPVLPDECRALLERVDVPTAPVGDAPPTPTATTDRDLLAALSHIDPTDRDTWRDVGFAIKDHYGADSAGAGHDDGFALWDAWSRGEFWAAGCPASYDADAQPRQWDSFGKGTGARVTVASIFHRAMLGGWMPPARFDMSSVFGEGAIAADTFADLVARVLELGGDARNVQTLVDEIRAAGCNTLQVTLLRNELKSTLRDAKLLDKDLGAIIDAALTPSTAEPLRAGEYGKNHTMNAHTFLSTRYPDGALVRFEKTWYAFNGRVWEQRDDDSVEGELMHVMEPSFPQSGVVTGTYQTVCRLAHVAGLAMNSAPPHLVIFNNGVLNLHDGALYPHDRRILSTKLHPYDYAPAARCDGWLAFLDAVFEGDGERVALLQEWLGYMLSGSYAFQKIMLMLGPKRSGKGTIGEVMEALVGTANFTGASLASFARDDFLDSLRGKTCAFSGDTEKKINSMVVETVVERIKKISGHDPVDFGRKYKDRATCRLPTRITLAANHIPRLFDDSDALSSRLLLLTFDVSFYGREDPYLRDRLCAEISGIAAWALAGYARLCAAGRFTAPRAAEAEAGFIAESYSPIRMFIDARLVLGGDNVVPSVQMYQAYRDWATLDGVEYILGRNAFLSSFKDATRGSGCKYGTHRAGDGTAKGFRGVTVAGGPVQAATGPAPSGVMALAFGGVK